MRVAGAQIPLVWRAALVLIWLATGLGAATALFVLGAWIWFAVGARAADAHPEVDAIAILSAGLAPDGALDIFTAARIETGLALWRAGRAPAIIVSGGPDQQGGRPTGRNVAEEMAAALIAGGVPAAAIAIEPRAVSTFENARFVLEIAEARGWRRLIVVTDDFHLARASLLFRWWRGGRARVASLAPAHGRRAASVGQMTLVGLREILAYPFNAAKLIGWSLLDAAGRAEGRPIR